MSIGKFSKICISDLTASSLSVNSKDSFNNSKKKNKSTKEVKYPVFLACCELTADNTWMKLFKKAAYGNAPKNFRFVCNFLYYVKQKKVKDKKPIMIEIDHDNAKVTFDLFTDFIKTYGNHYSSTDIEQSTLDEEIRRKNYSPEKQNWDKLHKNVKTTFLINFIYDIAENYELPREKITLLKHVINMGIYEKSINNNTITIKNNRITKIKGLKYDKNEDIFYIDKKSIEKEIKGFKKNECKSNAKNKLNVNQFVVKFEKYIDSTDKYDNFNEILKDDDMISETTSTYEISEYYDAGKNQ